MKEAGNRERAAKLNEAITAENVMELGERMAISALRYYFKFAYDDVRGLYLGLIHDINRKGGCNPSAQ